MNASVQPSRPTAAMRWIAAGGALLVWALGLLAVNPELHELLHPDAGLADHECVITLFSHGADDGAAQPVVVVAPLFRSEERQATPVVRLAAAPDYRLLPGRAPPAC